MGLITSYAALGSVQTDDVLPIVDVHDATQSPQGTTKKITVANLLASAGGGALVTPTAVKTANYTAAAGDFVPCDTTSGGFTVTLPSAPADKTLVGVKQVIQGGTNTVSVTCAGSDVFNKAGGAVTGTLTLLAQGMLLQYKASGGIWYVLADDLPLAQLDTRYASDSLAVHLAGTETVTGAKTFSLPPNLATQAVSGTATLAAASAPVVLTDTTSAAFTLTLPATPVTGEWFVIVDNTGQWAAHNLTIGRNGKNIDGAASNLTLVNQWGKLWLYYDGTAWWALAAGASNETPLAAGSAAAGTHASFSRADHVHPGGGGAANYGGIFGDGSDGSVTFDGAATILGLVPAASVYTMTRDIWCTGITVNSGVTLKTQNFRVFCAGTLTNNGTISNTGGTGNANGNAGGSAGSTTGIFGGLAGGAGNTAAGTTGVGGGGSYGVAQGGAGGTGSGGAGGGAGSIASTSTAYLRAPHSLVVGSLANSRMNGGSGGGGGGGDATNKGGGGGGGGGIVGILAWAVNNGGGTISAAGGPAGTPVTGNCGGGGGGGGGLILVFTLSAWTAGTTVVTGGALGNGVGTGTNGVAGGNGSVLNVVVQ